ncbi:TetR/AcrR family transcriptional regulator [Nonomuraea longicatena]|uniref:TetR/AcrR family transcriptional regulator n=1 Tax=Nonomuraea longicatena TaxID=83682 RepID=A0ABN1QLG5_9ACTN
MEEGLRERKKRQTRERIADLAMGLFMARGFDGVTVAEVARAADVSVNTVFNYFRTKEDLFMDRWEEVEDLPSRVVRERAAGESVLAAFRRDFLDALDTRHWRYGLNEGADVFAGMVRASPSLMARMRVLERATVERLARTLAEDTGAGPGDLAPRLVAAQIMDAVRLLSERTIWRPVEGESWAEIAADVRGLVQAAFGLLEKGIGGYAVRQEDRPAATSASIRKPP